jgi:hypothetical protein
MSTTRQSIFSCHKNKALADIKKAIADTHPADLEIALSGFLVVVSEPLSSQKPQFPPIFYDDN